MSNTFEYVEGYEVNNNYSEIKYFDVDLKTKEVQKIIEQPLLAGEMNSQCIGFRIPRYCDGVDLSTKDIHIIYIGPTQYRDISAVINVERNDEYVRFIWVVPAGALLDAGDLMCVLEFTSEDYVLKTKSITIKVEDTMQGGEVVPEPTEQEWYQELQNNYTTAVQKSAQAEKTAEETKVIVEDINSKVEESASNALTSATNAENAEKSAREAEDLASQAVVSSQSAAESAEKSAASAESANQQYNNLLSEIEEKGYINLVEFDKDTGELVLYSEGTQIGKIPISILPSDIGLSFDSGYIDDNGYLHLTKDGEDIEDFTPFFVGTGDSGGSSGSKLSFSLTSSLSFSVADTSETANVSFKFTSIDTETEAETGEGTLQIYVNDILKRSMNIPQGENTVNVFEFLSSGSNTVKLVITDSYGVSATRKCTITVESISLEWDLERTFKNTGTVNISLTPSGVGDKTLYIIVDDEVNSTSVISTSGYRVNKRIGGLTHGEHIIKAYCTSEVNGSVISSDVLVSAVAQVEDGNEDVVTASNFVDTEVEQFTNVTVPYRVIDPNNNPTEVEFIINNVLYNTVEVDQSEQEWTYKPTTAGELVIEMVCNDKVVWQRTITVNALATPVSEITEGLALKFDPASMTSNISFESADSTVALELSEGFDTVNGGLQNDEDGNRVFVVKKGDTATIPYQLFGDDTRKIGKEIKLVYKVENCSDFNATAISCMDSGIGLQVNANSIKCTSELTSIGIQTCEGMKAEIDINIEADTKDRIIRLYEGGSHAQIQQYSETDNFTQKDAKGITIGSADCDVFIYLIRVYTATLENKEILANHIFDGVDGAEITDRYNKSLIYDEATGKVSPEKVAAICPDASVFTLHADSITTAKDNKISGILSHIYTAGGPKHTFTVPVIDKAQGTSSVAYILAGLNHDFEFTGEMLCSDGSVATAYALTENSIPVNYFNFKANTASSEHINNKVIAEWFNRFQPYVRNAKLNDSRVRDTIEGRMAVMFYHNTGTVPVQAGALTVQPDETILYSVGCLNNSKKNKEVFAHNDTEDVAVIEFMNNTAPQSRFRSYDLTGETFDGKGNFDFRYLSNAVDKSMIISEFQKLLAFVVSCIPENATDEALTEAVTYDGIRYAKDTAEYRKAKYKAEADNYMEMDSIFYHQLFTLHYCMPDNRAKNIFPAYNLVTKKWHLAYGYDFDTAMGNDNEGGMTLGYGYLDTDTIGTKNVYNAADSALWMLNWEVFSDRLRDLYIDRENAGCWDTTAFSALCKAEQDKICTALWMEDAIKKYEYPYTLAGDKSFFEMCNGRKTLQREQFLKFQPQFISSYMRSGFCRTAKGIIRGYTPAEYKGVAPANTMTITPYCNTFIYFDVAQQTQYVRAYAGVPVTLEFPEIGSMNDTEINIYNADFIQDIGELACLYPGQCNLSAFERLKYARIGSSNSEYENTNLTTVSLSNCKSLEYLNVEGCSSLTQALDLGENLMLKELYTRRSGVTGVTFAKGGRIKTALLNSVSSITAKGLRYLESLTMATYTELKTLVVEDSPAFDALSVIQNAANLNRLRLTDVEWHLETAKLLVELAKLAGIDDDGYNTDTAVITGLCSVTQISEYRYNEVTSKFPKLEIQTDTENFVESYTYTFCDYDGTLLDIQIIEAGEDAEDPVTRVFNPIPIPTREPTIDTIHSFGGWDKVLTGASSNLTITAVYTARTRTYTVQFFDGVTLLKTEVVDAYGSAYLDVELQKEGYIWTGWSASTTNVTADVDTYAVYEEPVLPEYIKDLSQFDYLYSEDPADAEQSAYTMGQIYAICQAGLASTYFDVGSEIKLLPSAQSTIVDSHIVFQVYGFNHYRIADSELFANAVFGMKGLLNANRRMNSTNTNVGGWSATEMNTWLNGTMIKNLSIPWQLLIKEVQVLASEGNTSSVIKTSLCKLFLFSTTEIFGNTAVPYCNEVDADAETAKFPIFTDTSSRIKKTYNGTGSAGVCWLRSATPSCSTGFDTIYSNGTLISNNGATGANGVCFGFCI